MTRASASGESILIIEDDASIREGLELNLRMEGYRVISAEDSATGLELARQEAPDLILLDLMLPDGSGLELLRMLRREEREMQVLILTARGLESDKVQGLKIGADDYITKPFGLAELLARINSALRRDRLVRERADRSRIVFGQVEVDRARREVQTKGQPVKLTRREYDLLLHLVDHPDRVFSRDQLLHAVWGGDYEGTARTVDNFISSLRNKLERDPAEPEHILTVHGVGYRFSFAASS
jgi:DNA-binding response OmpR family regulator